MAVKTLSKRCQRPQKRDQIASGNFYTLLKTVHFCSSDERLFRSFNSNPQPLFSTPPAFFRVNSDDSNSSRDYREKTSFLFGLIK